jgi:hypothetical protein
MKKIPFFFSSVVVLFLGASVSTGKAQQVVLPLTAGGASGSAYFPLQYGFDAQPASPPTVGMTGATGSLGSNPNGYAGRQGYIDFGPNFATLTITEAWTAYWSWTNYNGSLPFASLWWSPTTDNVFNAGTDIAETRFNFGTQAATVGAQALWTRDAAGLFITPAARYLIVSAPASGTFASDRATELALVGYTTPPGGTPIFNQPFSSSTSVSSYFNASAPDSTTQFNNIGANASGGTWSINASQQLQLVRTGGSGSTNGAGFIRCTDLLGPPSILEFKFNFGISNINTYSNDSMVLDVGSFATVGDYNQDTAAVLIFNRLSIDLSPNEIRFEMGGTSSAPYVANGTLYALAYYLNGSGTAKTYTAPNGTSQTLNNNCASLWVGTTLVLNNIPRTGTNASLGDFRCRIGSVDSGTWKFDSFVLNNLQTPGAVVPNKITLNPSMVTAEEAHGNAGLLVDEQALAGDPANNLGGTPLNRWSPDATTWYYPNHAIIDLGVAYNLTDICLYDGAGSGAVTLSRGTPFNWTTLLTDPMTQGAKWNRSTVNIQTRYLRVELSGSTSSPYEIVLYGTPVSAVPPPPTPTIHTPPTIDQFMGINTFFNEPVNRMAAVGTIREYHNWYWNEGAGTANYPGYPNNQNGFNPNGGWVWNFDVFYSNMKNLGVTAFPCLQLGVPWINGSTTAKPVYAGTDPELPASYAAHADHLFQQAARYGATVVADNKLKLRADNARLTGLNQIRYFENWNEQDVWWGTRADFFSPYEYAAMSSADYDGHQGTMGNTVGLKNADPTAKLVMGGLARPDLNYIKAMKLWADYKRGGSFPCDVLNIHDYCNNGTDQSSGTIGVSPETALFKERMEVFRLYRDQYLPGKEMWVTEFGYDTNPSSVQRAPAIGTFSQEEVQGQWLVRSFLALAAAQIDRATQYMLSDVNESSTTKFDTSGLIHSKTSGYQTKPAWYYVYTMKNRLTGMRYESEQASGNPNVKIYRFKDAANAIKAYAVWCPTSNQTTVNNYPLTLQGSPTSATLITLTNGDINGVPSALPISAGQVTVNVSEKPVFVIVGTVAPAVVPEQKITLTPSMVVNESGNGNATQLVDEQATAGDPANGNGGAASTIWTPGWGTQYFPASAYIDLGQVCTVSKIYLKDGPSSGDVVVSVGSPGNWMPVFTDHLLEYDTWNPHVVVPVQTRYVRITLMQQNANVPEIVIYKK